MLDKQPQKQVLPSWEQIGEYYEKHPPTYFDFEGTFNSIIRFFIWLTVGCIAVSFIYGLFSSL